MDKDCRGFTIFLHIAYCLLLIDFFAYYKKRPVIRALFYYI